MAEDEEIEEALVVADAVPVEGVPPGIAPSVVTRASRHAWTWVRARSAKQLAAAGVVAALVVTTAAVAESHREPERTARIAAAPGGVLDLSRPVDPLWSAEPLSPGHFPFILPGRLLAVLVGDVGVVAEPFGALVQEHADGTLTALPGGRERVPVTTGQHTVRFELEGWDLRGLDLATGETRWTHRIPGETLHCSRTLRSRGHIGRNAAFFGAALPEVVCVVGQGTDAVIHLVSSDGGVTHRRPADVGEHTVLAPGPRNTLWRADRVDALPGGPEEAQGHPAALVPADVRVRAEDPRTGELIWERVLPATTDGGTCPRGESAGHESDHRPWIGTWSVDDTMSVSACGVVAVLTAGGHPLDAELRIRSQGALADGGVLLSPVGDVLGHQVLDEQGEVVLTGPGQLLDPWTTDGRGGIDLSVPAAERDGSGRLFTLDGPDVVAHGPDGDEAWRVTREEIVRSAVARAGDVLVLHTTSTVDWGPHLLALDQRTGEALWDAPLHGETGTWNVSPAMIGGAWTDGELLVVVTPGDSWVPGRPLTWTAHDLSTGAVVWQQVTTTDDGPGSCLAAHGRLLCAKEGTMSRIA